MEDYSQLTNNSDTVSYETGDGKEGEQPVAQVLVAAGDVGGGTGKNISKFYKSCLFYSLSVLKANFLRVHHLHLFLLLMQPQGFEADLHALVQLVHLLAVVRLTAVMS